jgi:hypothetical protein
MFPGVHSEVMKNYLARYKQKNASLIEFLKTASPVEISKIPLKSRDILKHMEYEMKATDQKTQSGRGNVTKFHPIILAPLKTNGLIVEPEGKISGPITQPEERKSGPPMTGTANKIIIDPVGML